MFFFKKWDKKQYRCIFVLRQIHFGKSKFYRLMNLGSWVPLKLPMSVYTLESLLQTVTVYFEIHNLEIHCFEGIYYQQLDLG